MNGWRCFAAAAAAALSTAAPAAQTAPKWALVSAKGEGFLSYKGTAQVTVVVQPGQTGQSGCRLRLSPGTKLRWEGQGTPVTEAKSVVLQNFRGRAVLSAGKRTDWFKVQGGTITLDGRGTGKILLKGNGLWGVNGQKGQWTKNGVEVKVAR